MTKIGKFDIFATYKYAEGLIEGMTIEQAKEYGYSIAVLGARARSGGKRGGGGKPSLNDLKSAAGAKKKKTITAEQFDKQIVSKLGPFFDDVFYPTMKNAVTQGLTYDEVKALVNIPKTWGAKIDSEDFVTNTSSLR